MYAGVGLLSVQLLLSLPTMFLTNVKDLIYISLATVHHSNMQFYWERRHRTEAEDLLHLYWDFALSLEIRYEI